MESANNNKRKKKKQKQMETIMSSIHVGDDSDRFNKGSFLLLFGFCSSLQMYVMVIDLL